jgi:alpha-glucoside transport system permease protein
MNRLVITILGIVAAVGGSAIVFVGINKLYDLTEDRYALFNAVAGGLVSAGVFGLVWGNRLVVAPEVVWLIAIVIGAATGYALGLFKDPMRRLAAGVAGGAALGLLLGMRAHASILPSIDPLATIVGLAVGIGVGFAVSMVSGGRIDRLRGSLAGGAVGWLFGAWLAADFDGSRAEVIIVAVVLGGLVGAFLGRRPSPNRIERGKMAVASRKYIFAGPALVFVSATLLVPLARTIWLSLLTGNPRELTWTGLTNYGEIFTDPGIIDFSGFGEIFSSNMLWLALVLLGGGVLAGRIAGRRLGGNFAAGGASLTMLTTGVVLFGFALFTSIRGTIANNLWWIFSVIIFAVSLGLAVAVLADRSKGENIAKSLIFLPMAISFVGAAVIWRLIYVARPPQDPQSGVFNTLWVQIGRWSNSTTAITVISVVLGLVIVGLAYLAWRGWQAEANAIVAGSLSIVAGLGYLIYRFVGPGIGGVAISEVTGELIADPVLFIQESPWNNFWMMVVFIWIYTGFAMVIFSAAIKAVPEDLLEAARIDGATESQTFWRVTVPQIFPTIGVVVTSLVVNSLKVFDIPKVMTNGNFDTQVLANEMWERAFTQLNFGLGSAVAVVLFIAVLPVMYLNIRRMQTERLG